MKILVTGNMGYVGPVVVSHLRAAFPSAEIEGFDAGYFAAALTGTETLPEYVLDAQHFGDVRNFDVSLLRGTDAVVHLAAISNDPIGNLFEKVTYDVNYRATVDMAKAAREAGVGRFVFASSCSMYGLADEGPRAETSALNPLTPYAKSKVMAEKELTEVAGGGMQVLCLRYSTACGMSARLRLDLVLNDFVACAVGGKAIAVLSDGTPWRPLINVSDMARAVEWSLLTESAADAGHLAVNVGCDEWNYQVADLARAVAETVPGSGGVSINTEAPPDRRSYRVDFGLFRKLAPDHQPQRDLTSSIGEIEQGLRSMGFDDAEFRSSGLMRINHLTRLREEGLLDDELRWTAKR